MCPLEDARKGGMRPAVKGPPSDPDFYPDIPDANITFTGSRENMKRTQHSTRSAELSKYTLYVEERKDNQEARPFAVALVTTRSLNRNTRIMLRAFVCYKTF